MSCWLICQDRDHPRACGEHSMPRGNRFVRVGSSPRLRGTLYSIQLPQRGGGIIPALAGNTVDWCGGCHGYRDHPRACGEHCSARAQRFSRGGSSPRLRGTPLGSPPFHDFFRIIPALAGNTPRVRGARWSPRDHPRACGEHLEEQSATLIGLGSSPRLRGTRRLPSTSMTGPGIIPALAGNTCRLVCCARCRRDHPRACGEHISRGDKVAVYAGSSPRLRGTRGRAVAA